MLALHERMVALYSVTGPSPPRGRLRHLFPRGAFRCSDGYLALNVPDDTVWKRLCAAMGRDDLIADARSASGTARAEHADELQPIIEKWLRDKTRAHAGDLLNASGVPAGPVYSADDVFADAHVAARKMLQPVQDPEVGEHRFARSPVLLSAMPEGAPAPAPALGQHTRDILGDVLGYPTERIVVLEQQQVVQSAAT
jgi:crotonobetainyl-CoA:carnitine CoA-transferase CaiB-like acyl-CoA transferase